MADVPAIAALVDITDAGSAIALGQAPAFAMVATYLTMADSLGLAMQNAIANQQRGQVMAGAALAQTLAMIIQKGATST